MFKTSIGDALFTKTQQRVLSLLYGKPEQSFYTNEIVRLADMGRGTITRELEKLLSVGLIVMVRTGNQNHYQANPSCPIYDELLGIVRKTFGLVDIIKDALSTVINQIDFSFVYGSIAKGEETASSDIDLLVVSESLAYADMMNVLKDAEESLGRPINPSIYTREQIQDRLKQENAFLTKVMEQPKLWVKDKDDKMDELIEKNRQKILSLARENGVCNVRVFGSMARNNANKESDLDLLVELEEGESGFALGGFLDAVSKLVNRKVDVVTEKSLHPSLHDKIMFEARAL